VIISESSPLIKKVMKLHSRKGRQKYGQYFVEGIRGVEQVLENGAPVEAVIYSKEIYGLHGGQAFIDRLNCSNLKIYQVEKNLFKKIGDTVTPQYVLAVVKMKDYLLNNIFVNSRLLLVIVDGVQDPGNLGTIIRTADAAGADGILLLKGTTDPYNPKCVRSTMGSIFSLPVIRVDNIQENFEILKEHKINIIAASLDGDVPYYRQDFTGNIAIIIGSEAVGISQEVCKYVNQFTSIPMAGKAESLNAAVACGIFLYKAVEQRLT